MNSRIFGSGDDCRTVKFFTHGRAMPGCKGEIMEELENVSNEKQGVQTSEFWVLAGVLFFVLLAATVLVWFGKITNAQWVTVITAVPTVLVSFYTTARSWLKGKAMAVKQ